MKRRPIFVTGIDTGVGKTLVSAIITEALKADYWKPIQCGNLGNSDTKTTRSLVSNSISRFHQEKFALKLPQSPHLAAKSEGKILKIADFALPKTNNELVFEGAGGLLVPINNKNTVVDLAAKWNAKVVLVSKYYLGSINHTLLSANYLRHNGFEVMGIVFNGPYPDSLIKLICQKSGLKKLLTIKWGIDINPEVVKFYSKKIVKTLNL